MSTLSATEAAMLAAGPALTAPFAHVPDPDRCGDCGYLLAAPGHQVACGEPG